MHLVHAGIVGLYYYDVLFSVMYASGLANLVSG